LDEARDGARASRIVAPVGGTVFERLAEPGEALTAGAPVIALDDISGYVVKLSVTLRDAERARAASSVTLLGPDGASLGAGKVNSIGTVPSTATGLYEVEIGAPTLPRAGELVTARFEIPATAGVIRVPSEAVVNARAGSEVYVLEGTDTQAIVHRRAIEIDRFESNDVVVRGGLREGERIVREGAGFLRDGDAVDIVN
jgi:RND family efflux transporter MFP subunit